MDCFSWGINAFLFLFNRFLVLDEDMGLDVVDLKHIWNFGRVFAIVNISRGSWDL
jgi:hypothetical protein